MLELHVWGNNSRVSIISPESLASSWLLNIFLSSSTTSFRIVTSSNTNISDIDKLPVLIANDGKKYHGYQNISSYLHKNFSGSSIDFIYKDDMNPKKQLTDIALINLYQTKLEAIHQFNLFINMENYENYTRKIFKDFFPFPMMYNQPLKFYNNAQELVKAVGLQGNKPGFLSFTGADYAAQTEYFNDEIDVDDVEVEDQIAISTLHERSILAKSKQNSSLKEGKKSIKCLHLLEEYLTQAISIREKENATSNFNTTSDILLYAYMYSMTFECLPDRFIYKYLKIKFAYIVDSITKKTELLNSDLYNDASIFRETTRYEVPSLVNEIAYTMGALKY